MSTSTPNRPVPAIPRRRGTSLILPALAVIVALGAGLIGGVFVGRHEGSTTTATAPYAQQYGNRVGARSGATEAGRGGALTGTITSISGSKLTVTTATGSTETVTVPAGAQVNKTTASSLSALHKGQRVTVIGTPSGSSGITARAITEGSSFGRGLRAGTGNTNG